MITLLFNLQAPNVVTYQHYAEFIEPKINRAAKGGDMVHYLSAKTNCEHIWRIARPVDPVSAAECSNCGAKAVFRDRRLDHIVEAGS